MTPRARRIGLALLITIAVLVVGRWSAFLLTEHAWATSISPAAGGFVTTWELLGFALDAAAIIIASLWFVIQALIVARAIASVQVTRHIGNLQLRETIPTRYLIAAAIASGVLLGLIAGAGAHAWRLPLALAWQGVRYGVTDPLLGVDVGVLVGDLPAWNLGAEFLLLLAMIGLAFAGTLYSAIGALRRDGWQLVVHPDARRHLGVLLAVLASAIACRYALSPYLLAVASTSDNVFAVAQARVHSAHVMTGVALATATLSLLWTLRGRTAFLTAGWLVLLLSALCERMLVPLFAGNGSPVARSNARLRQFDAMGWSIHTINATAPADSVPAVTSIWDEALLADLASRLGTGPLATTPAAIGTGAQAKAGWYVATVAPGDSSQLSVFAIADDTLAVGGTPLFLHEPREPRVGGTPWHQLDDPRIIPSAPAWRIVPHGVATGGALNRLLLAWARQVPAMLNLPGNGAVDWHLDPVERSSAVLPMFDWSRAEFALINGRSGWIVQGYFSVEDFPLSTRSSWRGTSVAGVAPVVICTIDATSGETRFYLDPSADALGSAWGDLIGSVIGPANTIPVDVRAELTYPAELIDAQTPILANPVWASGAVSIAGVPHPSAPAWINASIPARTVAFDEPVAAGAVMTATSYRDHGVLQIRLDHGEPDLSTRTSAQIEQAWNHDPMVLHLRDSVRATGDTMMIPGIRWHFGRIGGAAWRPLFAMPRRGLPTEIWLQTALSDHTGGGRAAADAWGTVINRSSAGESPGLPDAAVLLEAKTWMARADSAFRRGDMTAFGRAFEQLRSVLHRSP